MYNLSVDEISMVDGGGDGGYVSAVFCAAVGGVAGALTGYATRNPNAINTVTSMVTGVCMVAMGNSNNSSGNQTAAVSSGSYNGYGLSSSGGMMGR